MTNARFARLAALAILLSSAGCGSSDTSFATKYAPDFRRAAATVSVFGVYKDGRMSADAWDELAGRFASVFQSDSCEAAYSAGLVTGNITLASAIDDQTREDGVTDELVGLFAPAATADNVLVVTVAGLPSKPKAGTAPAAGATSAPPQAAPMRGGGRRGGRMGGSPSRRSDDAKPRDAYEVSASLFSVREKRTVGVVAMTYDGKNPDAALAAFVDKLRTELPGAKCGGWKHDVHVDAAAVRAARPAE